MAVISWDKTWSDQVEFWSWRWQMFRWFDVAWRGSVSFVQFLWFLVLFNFLKSSRAWWHWRWVCFSCCCTSWRRQVFGWPWLCLACWNWCIVARCLWKGRLWRGLTDSWYYWWGWVWKGIVSWLFVHSITWLSWWWGFQLIWVEFRFWVHGFSFRGPGCEHSVIFWWVVSRTAFPGHWSSSCTGIKLSCVFYLTN